MAEQLENQAHQEPMDHAKVEYYSHHQYSF